MEQTPSSVRTFIRKTCLKIVFTEMSVKTNRKYPLDKWVPVRLDKKVPVRQMGVVDKTGVTATSPICLIPLMLAAFGEMSQIVLVAVSLILFTTLCSLKIYHFLSHLVQSTITELSW